MKYLIIVYAGLLLMLTSCKRDQYYVDGGLANPNYPADMYQYLLDKPVPFDSVAEVIKLAGMEDQFRKEDFTFFAFDDDVIRRTIGIARLPGQQYGNGLNGYLYQLGRDTVKQLSDVPPIIWRKYLMRYMFKGVNKLKDYPQIDPNLISQYPGQLYYSLGGDVLNIGVIYESANNVNYIGPRVLSISYVYDISNPDSRSVLNRISSSDIKPTNGVVHTLMFTGQYIGFDLSGFMSDIYNTGLVTSGN